MEGHSKFGLYDGFDQLPSEDIVSYSKEHEGIGRALLIHSSRHEYRILENEKA